MKPGKKFLVALAGQPNVGKSTVFNLLTGLSQHVGNWPGKTVARKEGAYVSGEGEMRIIDLPGTYSLTAFSEEERIARDFIIKKKPDVVVLIAGASALERSLYLLSELLLLGPPIVIALNMMDVADEQGIQIDIDSLRMSLGIPVVPIIATKNTGVKELVSQVISIAEGNLNEYNPSLPDVSKDHMDVYHLLMEKVREHIPRPYTSRWAVTKLMEGDPNVLRMLKKILPSDKWEEVGVQLRKHEDSLLAVVKGRYEWIEAVIRASVYRYKIGQVLVTDRIDQVLTRPVFGIPILLGVLAVIFFLTYGVGTPIQGILEWLENSLAKWVEPYLSGTPGWVSGIIIEGVIGGSGTVLTFLPILIIFFASMAFLEDVGYMARAAFVMDRFMHIIGLHGKSFLPIFLGFGCNVPAVLGARIVESKKARLLTIFLAPFIPCTGRLVVLTFVTAAVFGEQAAFVSWSLVAVNILALGLFGILVSRLFLRGEPMPFIMELPLYHRPNPRTIGMAVWNRTKTFIKLAGTVILGFSIVLWLMSNFPGGTIEDSILGWIGRFIGPLGLLIGLDWRMIVALLASFVAKENSIAALGVLYGVGEVGLRNVLPEMMSHASALSFLVVLMLFIPCVATMVVMRQEMGSWKWFLLSLIIMFFVSFGSGMLAYHLALLLGI
jgi:ferrous iron transport protein B